MLWQPEIDLQLPKTTFFAHAHTKVGSMLKQIATQHQAKYELELVHTCVLVLHEFEPSFR